MESVKSRLPMGVSNGDKKTSLALSIAMGLISFGWTKRASLMEMDLSHLGNNNASLYFLRDAIIGIGITSTWAYHAFKGISYVTRKMPCLSSRMISYGMMTIMGAYTHAGTSFLLQGWEKIENRRSIHAATDPAIKYPSSVGLEYYQTKGDLEEHVAAMRKPRAVLPQGVLTL